MVYPLPIEDIRTRLADYPEDITLLEHHLEEAGDCTQALHTVAEHWTQRVALRAALNGGDIPEGFAEHTTTGPRIFTTSMFEMVASGYFQVSPEQAERWKENHRQWLAEQRGAWIHGKGPQLYVAVSDLIRCGMLTLSPDGKAATTPLEDL